MKTVDTGYDVLLGRLLLCGQMQDNPITKT